MNTEQTPVKEDLTTESTPFDLDWAKCGGVWLLKGKGLQKDYFFVGYVEIENRIYMTNAANGDGESLLKKDLAHVRMATRAGCDAAGVEYIEPPIRWMPIETMPERTTVLMSDGVNIDMRRAYKECAIQEGYTHWQPLPKPPKDE